jgi:hypothetical protein
METRLAAFCTLFSPVLLAAMQFASPPASARPAAPTPPASYENWGVCPFECCSYREWTARADVPVHAQRSDGSRVLFHLRPDEPVDALTGVVVTGHPAPVTIDRAVRDGYVEGRDGPQLSLQSGDVVYMLTPLGEGAYRFWYRGKVYTSGADLQAMPGVEGKDLVMTWWKQVRNKSGRTGWTRSDAFDHVDACG